MLFNSIEDKEIFYRIDINYSSKLSTLYKLFVMLLIFIFLFIKWMGRKVNEDKNIFN